MPNVQTLITIIASELSEVHGMTPGVMESAISEALDKLVAEAE